MIDAKRLAELMQPEELRVLADDLDCDISAGYGMSASDIDTLCCAAAVLREVAGREEAKRSNSAPAQEGDYTQDASRYAAMQGDTPTITEEDMAMSALPPKSDAPGEPEIFTEPMPPPITDDTPKIPLGTNMGTEYAILQWGDKGPCLCSKHRAGAWVFLEEMSVVGILGLMRGVHDGRYSLDEWVADGSAVTADSIRDGIAHAFAEMPDQIYNAISEAVFSHLQKHGVQCPKSGR